MNDIEKVDLYTRICAEFKNPLDQINLKKVFMDYNNAIELKSEIDYLKAELTKAKHNADVTGSCAEKGQTMNYETLPVQDPVDVNVRHCPPVEAVTLPDGSLENFTLQVGYKSFRCKCGCNVFHKPDRKHLELYECNGCGARYEGAF